MRSFSELPIKNARGLPTAFPPDPFQLDLILATLLAKSIEIFDELVIAKEVFCSKIANSPLSSICKLPLST